MNSEIKYKVKLQGSDGKDYVITYGGLWSTIKSDVMSFDEKLGWDDVTRSLRKDVNALEELIYSELLIPKARIAVKQFLKENPNVETKRFYHEDWKVGKRWSAWYYAKQELELEGIIVSESHGKGRNRTWKLKES